MNTRFLPFSGITLVAVLVASCLGVARQEGPPAALSAEQLETVLTNVREAVGWKALGETESGLRLAGSAQYQGVDVAFDLLFTARGEFVREVHGKLTDAVGHDGKTTWLRDRYGLTRELEMEMRDLALAVHWIRTGYFLAPSAPLDIELLEEDDDEARLRIRVPDTPTELTLIIDRESWLPSSLLLVTEFGENEWTFEDWKTVCGYRIAHTVTSVDAGGLEDVFSVQGAGPAPAYLRNPFGFHPHPGEGVTYDPEAQGRLEAKKVMSGHLLVHPRVDGEDVGWFIFDTGAGGMVIDPGVADELEMPAFGEVTAGGAAGLVTARYREASSFSLGPIVLENPHFTEIDLAFLSGVFGVEVAGICGYPFLARAVVELEATEGRISAFIPSTYELEGGSWQALRLHKNLPVVHASFEGGREGPFRLDTGAPDTVTFHGPAVERFDLLEGRKVQTRMGMGVGGMGRSYVGTLAWFELGGCRFEKPQVGFAQVDKGAFLDAYTLGNIGQAFLAPFRLVFDYPNRRIAFLPLGDR